MTFPCRPQATSAWQWYNYAEREALARGRGLLRVNLDETSVRLYPGRAKGAVFVSRKRLREGGGQNVAKWKRRCCLTHVGLICDRPEVQPQLPQFIVGNERTLPAKRLGALRSSCPPNVTLIRQKSAWSSAVLTGSIVRSLAVAVRSFEERLGRLQIVLILDAARIHYAPAALRACKAAGVWVVMAPAKLTWLIQPLDTHAFAQYKGHLQKTYQAARMASASAGGDLDVAEFLPCVYQTISHVLQGSRWATAFERDGYGARQTALSDRVKQRLQLQGPLDLPSVRPSEAQVRACLPRRAQMSMVTLWSIYDDAVVRTAPPAIPAPRATALAFDHDGAAASSQGPRTRARTRRDTAAMGLASAVASSGSGAAACAGAPAIYGKTRSETLRLKAASVKSPL